MKPSGPGKKINCINSLKILNDKLRLSGKKSTKLGSELYMLLLENETPLSAADIFKTLTLKVNLSSVYRTLNKFLQLGLILEDNINKESYYYISDNHHHHIICKRCGYIKCVPCKINFLQIDNFSGITHELTLKGICNECSKNFNHQ